MSATKQRSQKVSKTETATPVVEAPPVVASSTVVSATPVVTDTPTVVGATEEVQVAGSTLVSSYEALQARLGRLARELSDTRSEVKKFFKLAQQQTGRGRSRRRNTTSSPRAPTGFGKPKPVPEKLRVLLGLEAGAELPRPSVTDKLYEYMNTHNLRAQDKRIMRVNAELAQVFGFDKRQVEAINSATAHNDQNGLNFYNIQKHIARLYPAKETGVVASATPAPATRVTVEAEATSTPSSVQASGKRGAKQSAK